ncbi:MAG: hypothetical protein LBR87_05940, partial [Synergistaceae bacterium]|nr:hypothetical protein [Synergistaceae bacterium]
MSRMTASTAARTSKKDRAAEPKKAASCEYGTFEHIMLVLARLDEIYGHGSEPSGAYAAGEPLDGLILTLLSQNTNDRNRDTAYEALRGKYPKWGAVASAPREDIAAAIKSAGLGDIKAGRMKQ